MKFVFFLMVFLFLNINSTFSQENNINFYVVPAKSFIKINGNVISLNENIGAHSMYLKAGIYPIEIWSPNYTLIKDTIIVKETETLRYRKTLNKYEKAYVDYSREMNKYKKHKFAYQALDVSLALVNIGLITYVAVPASANKKLVNDINMASLRYQNAITPTEIDAAKGQFNQLNTKYKNSVNLKYYLGIPLLTVSSGLSIYYYIKRKKINQNIIKPKKYNPKNPFIETEFDLGLLNEGNGLYFGLKTKF